jgi:hypothetical protein
MRRAYPALRSRTSFGLPDATAARSRRTNNASARRRLTVACLCTDLQLRGSCRRAGAAPPGTAAPLSSRQHQNGRSIEQTQLRQTNLAAPGSASPAPWPGCSRRLCPACSWRFHSDRAAAERRHPDPVCVLFWLPAAAAASADAASGCRARDGNADQFRPLPGPASAVTGSGRGAVSLPGGDAALRRGWGWCATRWKQH